MIDDNQIAETAQPIGKNHAALGHGLDFGAFLGADEQPFPGNAGVFARGTETVGDLATHRQVEFAFQCGEIAAVILAAGQCLISGNGSGRGGFLCRRLCLFAFGRLFARDFCQPFDQAGKTLFVALQLADLVSLRSDLAGEFFQHLAAFGFLRLQRFPLFFLCNLERFDFLQCCFGSFIQGCHLREVALHVGDHFGACLGNIGEIVQLAGNLVRVLLFEHDLQRVLLTVEILLIELVTEQLLLRSQGLIEFGLLFFQGFQRFTVLLLLLIQLIKFAVGGADGFFTVFQLVGRVLVRFA